MKNCVPYFSGILVLFSLSHPLYAADEAIAAESPVLLWSSSSDSFFLIVLLLLCACGLVVFAWMYWRLRKKHVAELAGLKKMVAVQESFWELVSQEANLCRFMTNFQGNMLKNNVHAEFWPLQENGEPVPFAEWIWKEDVAAFQLLWKQLRSGKANEQKLTYRTEKYGPSRFFEMIVRKAVFGTETGFIGLIRDVSTRMHNVQERDDAKFMLQQILDHLPGYVFCKDVENNFRYLMMNANGIEQLQKNFVGREDFEIFGKEQMQGIRARDEEIVRTGQGYVGTEILEDVKGNKHYVKVYKSLLTRSDGSRFILGCCVDLTHERKLERELEESVRKLDASIQNMQSVNRCLKTISSGDDIATASSIFLKELGMKSGADRCCIFRYDKNSASISNTDEWVRTGVASLKNSFQNLKYSICGAFIDELSKTHSVLVEDTAHPPAGLEIAVKEVFRRGIRSALSYGIFQDGALLGYVEMNFIHSTHKFTAEDLRRIQEVCNFYQLAYERDRRLKEIAYASAIQKQLLDNVPMPILFFDLDRNILGVNRNACESVGMPETKLIGRKCYEVLCNCPQPPDWCPMSRTVHEKKMIRIEYEGHGRQYMVSTVPVFDNDGNLVNILEMAQDVSAEMEQARQISTKNLLLNRAADLAKITYFIGNSAAEIKIIGGNSAIGLLAAEDRFQDIRPWLIEEDREKLEDFRLAITSGKLKFVDMICRTDATGRRCSYRMIVVPDEHAPGTYIGAFQDISESVAMEIERKKLIGSLKNYAENEKIVNECLSQIFLEEDFKKNVDAILKIIASHLSCDRVYFGVFDEAGQSCRFNNEWLNEGVLSLKTIRDRAFYDQFQKWKVRFEKDEQVTVTDVHKSIYADVLQVSGCRTLICSPVLVEHKLCGVLGVGFIRERRNVSELDKNIMRSAARIIALSREHQLQREALDALDRQNRIIFNSMQVPVCLFDRSGALIRGNPAAAEFTGTSLEQIMGSPCYENLCHQPGIPDSCPVRNVLKTGLPYTSDINVNQRDCRVTAIPVRDRDGSVSHVLESVVDMTETNESKRKLEAAMLAAQTADRAKSSFLATMSHELRTPLNAVIGFTELLKSANLSPKEESEALDAIHEAGSALLELINDVLDLSKLEAGKMDIVPEFQNMRAFLESISKIFTQGAKSKNLNFSLKISPELPESIQFDRKRLRQVVVNILGNAFKFTREGEVILSAAFKRTSPGSGELRLEISDTGSGMSAAEVEEIFEPFKQHHARDIEGSGLGLVISQQLIHKMNGRIEVESEPGKGSTFKVILNSMAFRMEGLLSPGVVDLPPVNPIVSSGRLLLVDDVEMNLQILRAMVKRLGYEPVCASSASVALELLKTERPALILTDLWMPGMNGFEFAEAVERIPGLAQIPIVAVTADVQIQQDGKNLFAEILFKPLTLNGLKEALSRILKKN